MYAFSQNYNVSVRIQKLFEFSKKTTYIDLVLGIC